MPATNPANDLVAALISGDAPAIRAALDALPPDTVLGRTVAADRMIELGRIDLLTDAEREAAIARRRANLKRDPHAGRISGGEQAWLDQQHQELHALGAYR
jgi:hypothetical protein